jgi:hypothetical protein
MRIGVAERSAPHRQIAPTDGIDVYKTVILKSAPDAFPAPTASLIEQLPGQVVRQHFHFNSQFQVFVKGSGLLGRKQVGAFVVQYVAPHTGYGPIVAGDDGIWYVTLRPSLPSDKPGYQPVLYLPEAMPVLERSSRKFQVHSDVRPPSDGPPQDTSIEPVLEPTEEGMAAWWVRLPPRAHVAAPSLPNALARYCLVASGSLRDGSRALPYLSVIWSEADEAVTLTAGDDGAEVIVMQFPRDAY